VVVHSVFFTEDLLTEFLFFPDVSVFIQDLLLFPRMGFFLTKSFPISAVFTFISWSLALSRKVPVYGH
jgi:hypothetical protein